jgi:hypothetical protein
MLHLEDRLAEALRPVSLQQEDEEMRVVASDDADLLAFLEDRLIPSLNGAAHSLKFEEIAGSVERFRPRLRELRVNTASLIRGLR